MTDYSTRTEHEATTYRLFDEYVDSQEFSSYNVMVAGVFKAMYHASLTVSRIEAIAQAMYGYETVDLQKTLTKLTRAKVLRSRQGQGKRMYEVNY